ncbi:MAG TPA: sulfurtransferase [Chloroflexota bacterium]|nr:sulfurtransferase [Chloroflexota bacterium]
MAGYAHPELLAETDWLAAHLNDPKLRIVDCRYYYDGRVGRDAYREGHIPGAVYMAHPIDLSDPTATPPNLVPGPEQVAATMSRFGIDNDTVVVGYDDEGAHTAARLWWVLTYYGHTKVKLLNGGIVKWLAEGRPVESGEVVPPLAVFRPGLPRTDMRVRGDELRAELNDPRLGLLDVRRATEYSGAEVRAARGGRIPGAIHLFWQDNLNPDWTFRNADEIRARHEAAGATPDKNVVTYCQSGIRASHAAFSLYLIGYENVRMYDGSWNEWGNRGDLPIETGG